MRLIISYLFEKQIKYLLCTIIIFKSTNYCLDTILSLKYFYIL